MEKKQTRASVSHEGVEIIYNIINHYSVGGMKKDLNLATKALGKHCANSKICKQ